MKVQRLKMSNFMLFEDLDISWSKNINIISGENSTGKTTLIKLMYSMLKPVGKANLESMTKEKLEGSFVEKMIGVFRPDDMKLGRMVSRRQGSNRCDVAVELTGKNGIEMEFSNRHEKHAEVKLIRNTKFDRFDPIYLPPKEMISATEHFQSLYEDYHIDFEETYYDLTKLLDKPLKKGANTAEQKVVLSNFEGIMDGSIIQRDKKFYLKVSGAGEFEMGLVSEGYRKLATIIYLISSGSLDKNSILFWDEPETNMNPKMVRHIVEAVVELAKMGVQVFITTHDYFVQQSFNMLTEYPKSNKYKLDVQFVSLYLEDGHARYETGRHLSDLNRNAIMEEFDNLYDREQNLIYEDWRK